MSVTRKGLLKELVSRQHIASNESLWVTPVLCRGDLKFREILIFGHRVEEGRLSWLKLLVSVLESSFEQYSRS